MIFGPLQFDNPWWLLLAPALWVLILWIARKSLTGLGTATRYVALGLRLVVATLLVLALAEPAWRLPGRGVSVLIVRDSSASMPTDRDESLARYLAEAVSGTEPEDRLGLVTAATQARAAELPLKSTTPEELVNERIAKVAYDPGPREGTDLASGISLALATKPEDTAARIALVSDGNETSGSLLNAAAAAKSAGVPIDVLPVPYTIERELVFEDIVAPATARKGQVVTARLVLSATRPTSARVSMLINGRPFDLTPNEEGVSQVVDLDAGRNIRSFQLVLSETGPQRYEAVIEPVEPRDDTIVQNNTAMGVTFVTAEGEVLVYSNTPEAVEHLVQALDESRINAVVHSPIDHPHESLVELQRYDAVVLANIPAGDFSLRQQQELAAYVHDAGGGLVMLGGPESFGAGGWIGTPIAEVLPVNLDPPQKRQIPRGALALVMHSCEMPQGNYWGQQTAQAAANALSRLDVIGVLEWDWTTGVIWAYPMQEKGDGTAVARAINGLRFGDMPDFDAAMQEALDKLKAVKAGQKHCIIISDADPSGPAQQLVQDFIDAKISVTTVAVFPHSGSPQDPNIMKMSAVAQVTGGSFYFINQQNQLATLPQIFVKEAQIVRRPLIWEGDPVSPVVVNVASEPMRGMGSTLPAITGYVVTADREGLALTTARGPNDDPIVAHWQYGLGRSVVFTSDAASRWSADWLGWGSYRAFWDQHIRWAMRPSGSANVSVVTDTRGEETRVIVTALDAEGDSLNFARFKGRIVHPDMTGEEIDLSQTGPGRYEGRFESTRPGSYLLTMRYDAPGKAEGATESGVVQSAVSRPFADEHRALRDNTPLLRQAAAATGGRVLNWNPATDNLFSREGLSIPVATVPIWLALTLIGLGLFLADVAVRRVRIDIPAMARAVRRIFKGERKKAAAQVDSLRAARAKARERMAARSDEAAKPTAQVKFEADAEYLKRRPGSPLDAQATTPPIEGLGKPKEAEKKPAEEEEAGMSRLLQAKKRARDTMGGDQENKS